MARAAWLIFMLTAAARLPTSTPQAAATRRQGVARHHQTCSDYNDRRLQVLCRLERGWASGCHGSPVPLDQLSNAELGSLWSDASRCDPACGDLVLAAERVDWCLALRQDDSGTDPNTLISLCRELYQALQCAYTEAGSCLWLQLGVAMSGLPAAYVEWCSHYGPPPLPADRPTSAPPTTTHNHTDMGVFHTNLRRVPHSRSHFVARELLLMRPPRRPPNTGVPGGTLRRRRTAPRYATTPEPYLVRLRRARRNILLPTGLTLRLRQVTVPSTLSTSQGPTRSTVTPRTRPKLWVTRGQRYRTAAEDLDHLFTDAPPSTTPTGPPTTPPSTHARLPPLALNNIPGVNIPTFTNQPQPITRRARTTKSTVTTVLPSTVAPLGDTTPSLPAKLSGSTTLVSTTSSVRPSTSIGPQPKFRYKCQLYCYCYTGCTNITEAVVMRECNYRRICISDCVCHLGADWVHNGTCLRYKKTRKCEADNPTELISGKIFTIGLAAGLTVSVGTIIMCATVAIHNLGKTDDYDDDSEIHSPTQSTVADTYSNFHTSLRGSTALDRLASLEITATPPCTPTDTSPTSGSALHDLTKLESVSTSTEGKTVAGGNQSNSTSKWRSFLKSSRFVEAKVKGGKAEKAKSTPGCKNKPPPATSQTPGSAKEGTGKQRGQIKKVSSGTNANKTGLEKSTQSQTKQSPHPSEPEAAGPSSLPGLCDSGGRVQHKTIPLSPAKVRPSDGLNGPSEPLQNYPSGPHCLSQNGRVEPQQIDESAQPEPECSKQDHSTCPPKPHCSKEDTPYLDSPPAKPCSNQDALSESHCSIKGAPSKPSCSMHDTQCPGSSAEPHCSSRSLLSE